MLCIFAVSSFPNENLTNIIINNMKKALIYFLVIAVLISMWSCSNDDNPKWSEGSPIPASRSIELTAEEQAANDAINELGFKIFNMVLSQDCSGEGAPENMTFSPASMSFLLAMRTAAYDKATEQATLRLLGIEDVATLNSTANKLMRYLASNSNGSSLNMANAVFYDQSMNVSPAFTDLMNKTFYSSVKGIDMSAANAADIINGWCSDNTGGLIPKMYEDIPSEAMAILLNVILFDGKWNVPFDKERTKESVFHGLNADRTCQMMEQTCSGVGYFHYPECQSIRLPFTGLASTITFVLPQEGVDIAEFSKKFTLEYYRKVTSKDYYPGSVEVDLWLPRFDMATEVHLNGIFEQLGLPSGVQLTGMGVTDYSSSKIKQKSRIQIDEEGVTFTAGSSNDDIGDLGWSNHFEMRCDRPFFFVAENRYTGSVLLAGRVCDL